MFWKKSDLSRLYLDYAAATPTHGEVLKAMLPYFSDVFANASAIHKEGKDAKSAIEQARLDLARSLGVKIDEVFFTASGTESNNLALYGYVRSLVEDEGRQFSDIEIITTKLEHPSVLEVVKHLSSMGVVVKYADVDEVGKIQIKALPELLTKNTALVSFAYANSEIGVVQDVKRITRLIHEYNKAHKANIKTHLDASQAPLWLPCQMPRLGVDLMTLDAGKCEGPKGVGVLVVRGAVKLKGFVLGGGQESGLRAGTENTPLIVGASKAVVRAQMQQEKNAQAVSARRDKLIKALCTQVPGAVLNGPVGEGRIANNVNISIPGLDTEYAVVVLDAAGIAASTKSACSGAGGGESVVVKTTSADAARALSTIRFSLGPETILGELEIARIVITLQNLQAKMHRFDSAGN